MKPIATLIISNETIEIASFELVVELNATGRGFIIIKAEKDSIGKTVRINIGRNNESWRWFTGYVVRDQPADNGYRKLFIRELTGIFESSWPISMQHPTLRQLTEKLTTASGLTFVLPTGKEYTDRPIPHFVHSGNGWQLLNNIGRAFNIKDYIWQQLPDGTVWVGEWGDSRFAGVGLMIPPEIAKSFGGGDSMTMLTIPTVRPGVVINNHRITRVSLKDGEMTLTWTPLKSDGTPAQKAPLRRQVESLYPEMAAGLHLPKLGRIENHTEPAALGDIADPFRPRYAVGVQLLNENGADNKNTPVYPAVQLPVTMGGDESGFMQYPEPGTLVEVAFQDGRPDKPFIRQVLPSGASLPAIKPGEQLQQQRAEVFQRVTKEGSWQRETDQRISEISRDRTIHADTETRQVIDRNITVQADDSKTVIGTQKLMAGAVIQIAKGDYTVGTSSNMLTKVGGTATETVTQGKAVDIGGTLVERITGARSSASATLALIASTVKVGTEDTNVLTLLIETLDLIHELAQQTAAHTHPDVGTPTNAASIAATATTSTALKAKYSPIIE